MHESTLEPGHVVAGRYRVVRRLGAGGMGAVYEAEQLGLGRMVAIKVLLKQFSLNEDMSARFMREARAAAQIGHPGIVQVFDLGTDNGVPFLVMERLEGEELSARIERASPLPVDWVVRMAVELLDALQAAHDHGIVHRDLKPPNVFLARQGRRDDVVKVLDFGIAKLTSGADDIQTRTGAVFGTPMYMAPEQLRDSKDVDGRADVYAIGCLLFQALTGKPPFQAPTYPDLVFRICSAPRPSATDLRSDVPAWLSAIVTRAIALEPQDRFASPAELAHALGAPESRPPLPKSAPDSESIASAPTELASSAAALTPHSRTAPPVPASAFSARARIGLAGVAAVGVLGLTLVSRPWAPVDTTHAAASASTAPSSLSPDPILQPTQSVTVPAASSPTSSLATSASVPAASSAPRKNVVLPKPAKRDMPTGPAPPELVPP